MSVPVPVPVPLPTNKMMLRSPYWITVNDSNLKYILVDLYLWLGEASDQPTKATIRLKALSLNKKVASLDIADNIRDYIDVKFSTDEESNAILVSYVIKKVYRDGATITEDQEDFIAFDGYSTFLDGQNYSATDQVLMSTEKISSYTDTINRIPVLSEQLAGYRLQVNAGAGGYVTFHTVTGLNPATSTENAVTYINTSYQNTYADRVIIDFSTVADKTIDVEYIECNKYGVIIAYFVNRFGAVEQFHFTGKFNVSMASDEIKYTRNIRRDGNYNPSMHQDHILQKNGAVSFNLNTGWIPEQENDTILEMLMSEQIWLTVPSDKFGVGFVPKQANFYTLPVHITTKNHTIKSILNDKLINYNFTFKSANDWINSIR